VVAFFPDRSHAIWGVPVACDVLYGESRALASYREHQGTEIAGAAFHHGYYVELATVRRASLPTAMARAWSEARRRAAAHVEAPLAADAGGPCVLFPDAALRVALRLAGAGSVPPAAGAVDGVDAAEEASVAAHEAAHVLDARRMLPIAEHPLAVLRWLARAHFSLAAAEARLEEHAYWSALVHGPDPHGVVADLMGFLPEPESGAPHARAAHDLLTALCRWLYRHADAFPALDRRRVMLHQLTRLAPDELRRAAVAAAATRDFGR
jgi:hypothetical protein